MSKEDLAKAGSEHGKLLFLIGAIKLTIINLFNIALLIMNHTYETDWLFGWMFCEKVGVLGNCKAYAKKVISYIPTIGMLFNMSMSIFPH
jgi:hypothetical protein